MSGHFNSFLRCCGQSLALHELSCSETFGMEAISGPRRLPRTARMPLMIGYWLLMILGSPNNQLPTANHQ